jgi:hypothetical protein
MNDGAGLAALLVASGLMAQLQRKGVLAPSDTLLMLESAIARLDTMPQNKVVLNARTALEALLAVPRANQP